MMNFIVTLVSSLGGATVLTIIIIRFFGTKIVDNLFNKQIESYKFKINLEFDRISKINQREFEVLPVLWQKLIDHKKNLELYTNEWNTSADLNSLTEIELQEYVKPLKLEKVLKDKILNAPDKNLMYKDLYMWNGKIVLQRSYFDFIYYYQNNKIFLTDKINEKSNEICNFLESTLTVYDLFIGPQTKEVKQAARNDFKNTFGKLTNSLGELIKDRLKFPED